MECVKDSDFIQRCHRVEGLNDVHRKFANFDEIFQVEAGEMFIGTLPESHCQLYFVKSFPTTKLLSKVLENQTTISRGTFEH